MGVVGVVRVVDEAMRLVRRRGLALGERHRPGQYLHIKVIAHRLHVAVLALAQKAARAPDLKVPHGDAEA